ncbi:Glycoside hydrolase superfamily [Phytophthora cactorum]|nr:Glycoside hydrolase superfamily [Phytophthora cactorum]
MKIFATTAALFASLSAHTATAGYVTTSGTNFELDGKPFYVFGTNAYWASEIHLGELALCSSKADLATIFNTMAKNDLSVCRTWGFADLNETGTAPYNVVYQLWENGKATVNTGDTVSVTSIRWSRSQGCRRQAVVPSSTTGPTTVALLGGKYHDDFYTDEKIKAAYKNFVKTFVKRYADEETIMAWQLCNESRGNCNAKTLTDWMTEMSSYIKSLDSNHLVASGSEGFMNTDKSVYLYSGPSGVDFDANLAIDSIDYGAYHAYPDSWGVATSEAKSWGGKPVILEEYGIKPLDSASYLAWSNQVYTSKSNMQYWQFGVKSLSTHDDGYAIFDEDDLFSTVIAPLPPSSRLSVARQRRTRRYQYQHHRLSWYRVQRCRDASFAADTSSSEEAETTTEAPTATTATPSAVDASSDTAAESAADGSDTEASADTTQESTGSAETTTDAPAATTAAPSSDKCAIRGRRA